MFIYLHKKLYRQYSKENPRNVGLTAFFGFRFLSKLWFGDVFIFIDVWICK